MAALMTLLLCQRGGIRCGDALSIAFGEGPWEPRPVCSCTPTAMCPACCGRWERRTWLLSPQRAARSADVEQPSGNQALNGVIVGRRHQRPPATAVLPGIWLSTAALIHTLHSAATTVWAFVRAILIVPAVGRYIRMDLT